MLRLTRSIALCLTSGPTICPSRNTGILAIRKHATHSQDVSNITDTNRNVTFMPSFFLVFTSHLGAEATLKRFWKTVGIDRRGNEFAVTLDQRPLKTPSGNTLLLPQNKRLVATLIAAEWEAQETLLKPHALPMVRRPLSSVLFKFDLRI
jgi:ATP12 chaperone protein